jgi:hypothetical protein
MKTGHVNAQNNYTSSTKYEFFHPTNWLSGVYTVFANSSWPVNGKTTSNLLYNNSKFVISSDWGVRITNNGVTSCIRTLGDVATFGGNTWTIQASRVYEGK